MCNGILLTSVNSSDMQVSDDDLAAVEKLVREAGVWQEGKDELAGWKGGRVWLVPTYKNFEDWKPVAERILV